MWMETVKRGLVTGLKTTWWIGKITFPATFLVSILQHTPVLNWLIQWIEPIMGWIGLSGDATIPLVLGMTLNLYAAVAGALTVELTIKEIFIIATMLSFCHALIIESAVAVKVGVKIWLVLVVRLGLAIIAALTIHHLWQGGQEIAQYGMMTVEQSKADGAIPIIFASFKQATAGMMQLMMIVIPLMLGIQFLKDYNGIVLFSKLMSPFTRLLRLNQNASVTLAAGFIFGLAYGAGVIVEAVKNDGVSKEDVTKLFLFLLPCHAIIEDTIVFLPLGAPIGLILLIRFATALLFALIVIHLKWRPKNRIEGNVA